MTRTLALFGAGNVGRSFIGQLFARNGYEVVFIDIDTRVVDEINRRGEYDVVIKNPDGTEGRLHVSGVRAVDARDTAAVRRELAGCDLAATAVGAGALASVAALIRQGLERRLEDRPERPLDVILAENVRDAAEVVSTVVSDAPDGPRLLGSLGLVQTSIGKMVPLVPADVAARDPLLVFAEPYNTLIVDENGFRGPVPEIPEIRAVRNIRAYVDRKLFMHNLGHAAVAYVGYRTAPERRTIADAVGVAPVREAAEAAMDEAANALAAAYPDDLDAGDLRAHRDELLERFANPALGDTVFRVGRDLPRKLSRDDRVVGAMRLAARHDLPCGAIARVYRAALDFTATNERGEAHPPDADVVTLAREQGVKAVVHGISGLDTRDPVDRRVADTILRERGAEDGTPQRKTS